MADCIDGGQARAPHLSTCRVAIAHPPRGTKERLTPCTRRSCGPTHFRLPLAARTALAATRPAVIVPASTCAVVPAVPPAKVEKPAKTVALSRTPKFAPWIRQLEGELLTLGLQVVEQTSGERLESGAEDEGEEEEQDYRNELIRRDRESSKSEHMEGMRRLGGSFGKLLQLIHNDLLPMMPSDPEALFLAASGNFIARRFEDALNLMQTSIMATDDSHCTAKQLGARHYFVALIAIRIIGEADKGETEEGMRIKSMVLMDDKRQLELHGIIERGIREALRLDPKLHSAYIDSEMLAQYRFPTDAHARVALHADLVAAACETRKYWVDKMQRPMHFYPKLASRPWWDASEFPWALKLMQNYAEIRQEVLRMRQPATEERKAETWDAVGSKHDIGDRELVENGAWTELVLLNRDEKVASLVTRNRRLCPLTLKILDGIPAASDMAKRGVGECTFSALHGGAHLKPHCGSTNCRLTCHLPLIVPKGNVSIRVGDETRPYREGELMIFDDSWEHEVWQQSKKEGVRVVLLIRFWHPDIPPNRWPEAYHHMKKLYKVHKRRLMVPPLQRPSKLDTTPTLTLDNGQPQPAGLV